LARERYLLGDQEETINKLGAEITADTKKSKWENFWFYHKWHIVIIATACLLVGWFVHDMVAKVNPDYQIGLITEASYPNDVIEGMQTEIAKYGKDLNGDGKVVVQINSYIFSKENTSSTATATSSKENASSTTVPTSAVTMDPQVNEANVVRFMADISNTSSAIFLTDDASFKSQQKVNSLFAYLDGTKPKAGATDFEKMRVSWNQCKLLSQFKISTNQLSQSNVQKLLGNLNISMRVSTSESTSQKNYYTQSKALLNKLVYDK